MRLPFTKIGIQPKVALGNIILIVNVFVWYICASIILRDAINEISFSFGEELILNIILFLGIVVSVLAGAFLINKVTNQKCFLITWTLIGVFSSFALMMLENVTIVNVSFLLLLVGISLGLGLSKCMAIFADITKEDNRARFGSIILLSMFLGMFALQSIMPASLSLDAQVLAIWRLLSLVGILLLGNFLEKREQKQRSSIILLFKDRSMFLYFFPWTMFSMINYLGWSINSKIHGEDFVYFSALVSNILAGVFAIMAGFLADNIGRKRTLMGGFIVLGLGYALLGIYPFNVYAWYFYTLVDGIAWGIFYVIFWFTIWGDLAHGKSSEKYYAIGLLPYALSGFLRVTLGPFIANMVSEYAIFSFAAFFLFLAVLPLMYAPETLPEKTIRERELKKYIEKAKKVKEKYA